MKKFQVISLLAMTSVYAIAAPAFAQGAPKTDATDSDNADIIVTGTLLRGTAPVGSNSITVDAERIAEVGANSTNELLASIPQVTNYFNRVPVSDLSIAVNQIQIARPNLRNISPNNAASSATLILVDGHRIASAGVNQASIDPDLIPTGAIERVEVVTEGGSATYGADAVAGVINFITRKRFDGLKIDGHYGFANDYWQWDASATAGKDWGSGSAYISYTYTKNDALFGRDRSFIRNVDYSSQPYLGRDRACANPNLGINVVFVPANFTISSTNYALPGLVANTVNRCDNSQNKAVVPKAERHGVFAGLYQQLDDATTVELRAYYGQRKTSAEDVLTGTVSVGSSNPYAVGNLPPGVTLGGGVVATRAVVSFSLQPLLGLNSQRSDTFIKEGGVVAEIKRKIGENWQVRGLLNFSESDSKYELTQLSPTRLAAAGGATTTATAFNPFNVVNNNAALVADLIDSEIAGQARDQLFNARLIVDGTLFSLPGGDVKLAVGYEYAHDRFQQRFNNDVRIGALSAIPYDTYTRHVNSLFGELQVPVLGDNSALGSLTLSGSLRYDNYSDFGNTTNPKIGATYKPAEWLSIRGNYGTSFTAPTPLDQLGSSRNTISSFPFVAFTRPGDTVPGGSFTVALQGSQPNLSPQTADTWSVGFDVKPPFIPGLSASLSYYDVKFSNILSTPTPGVGIFTNFPGNIATNVAGLTAAQLRAFGALAPGGSTVVESLIASGSRVYETVDFRTGNFGILKVRGLDFDLRFSHETGFGSVDAGVNGIYQISRKAQVSSVAAVTDDANGEFPRLFFQETLGASIGGFRAQATFNHNSGYKLSAPTTSVPVQTRVASFDTFNLFFKYEVPADSGVFKDLSFSLNVNNILDATPPVLLRNDQGTAGYTNGFTLGRLFQFGISKKF